VPFLLYFDARMKLHCLERFCCFSIPLSALTLRTFLWLPLPPPSMTTRIALPNIKPHLPRPQTQCWRHTLNPVPASTFVVSTGLWLILGQPLMMATATLPTLLSNLCHKPSVRSRNRLHYQLVNSSIGTPISPFSFLQVLQNLLIITDITARPCISR
jgi:hypothetical protein